MKTIWEVCLVCLSSFHVFTVCEQQRGNASVMPRISFTLVQPWLVQTSKSGWKVHSSRKAIFHIFKIEMPSTTPLDAAAAQVIIHTVHIQQHCTLVHFSHYIKLTTFHRKMLCFLNAFGSFYTRFYIQIMKQSLYFITMFVQIQQYDFKYLKMSNTALGPPQTHPQGVTSTSANSPDK